MFTLLLCVKHFDLGSELLAAKDKIVALTRSVKLPFIQLNYLLQNKLSFTSFHLLDHEDVPILQWCHLEYFP